MAVVTDENKRKLLNHWMLGWNESSTLLINITKDVRICQDHGGGVCVETPLANDATDEALTIISVSPFSHSSWQRDDSTITN